MRGIVLTSLLVVMASISAHAEPFRVPRVPDRETRQYTVYYKGMDISSIKGETPSERIMVGEAAKDFYGYYFWRGEGEDRHLEYERKRFLNNGTVDFYRIVFKPGDQLIMDRVEESMTSPDGKEIRFQSYKNISDPFFGFPDDIFHPYVIETAFRGMPLEVGYERTFHVWMNPQAIASMKVKVEKIETINAKAGTYECYKVVMTPIIDDFVGPVVGPLLQGLAPDYNFWLATTPPHTYVRYAGPLGESNTVDAPTEIHEMVSIKIDSEK